jgi:hypothetical protein
MSEEQPGDLFAGLSPASPDGLGAEGLLVNARRVSRAHLIEGTV